jgi:steroid delta-isomerase-like uncharacterized protein
MFEAINDNDAERMVDLVNDDIVIHTPVPGIGTGKEGMRQLMTIYFSSFMPQHVDVHDIVAEGDRVAVRHTHHLTHNGEFAGIPPTGRELVVEGIEMYRVRDGKVSEMWHHDDFLGLMQQIGAIPVPA